MGGYHSNVKNEIIDKIKGEWEKNISKKIPNIMFFKVSIPTSEKEKTVELSILILGYFDDFDKEPYKQIKSSEQLNLADFGNIQTFLEKTFGCSGNDYINNPNFPKLQNKCDLYYIPYHLTKYVEDQYNCWLIRPISTTRDLKEIKEIEKRIVDFMNYGEEFETQKNEQYDCSSNTLDMNDLKVKERKVLISTNYVFQLITSDVIDYDLPNGIMLLFLKARNNIKYDRDEKYRQDINKRFKLKTDTFKTETELRK